MKKINLGPLGPTSYRGSWTENGLRMIERWINTLTEFRGALPDRDGSDGLVPQPKAGDDSKVLFGDGHWRNPTSGGGSVPPGSIPIYDIDGDLITDSDLRYDPTTDTLYAPHIETFTVVADTVTVDPEVYGPGWDGDNTVPTKNDVYDKIESLPTGGGGGAPAVPVFFKTANVNVSVGINEYTIISSAVAVVTATKVVWINATVSGSGRLKKKVRRGTVWTFDMQLRDAATGTHFSLGKATVRIPANGKTTSFALPIIGSMSRLPAATYHVVLISSFAGSMVPGPLTVNVMGQAP